MRHRLLIQSIAVLCSIAVVSCAQGPAAPSPVAPTLPAAAVRPQALTVVATITYPTRVPAPILSLAPDLTGQYLSVGMANFHYSISTLKARVGEPIRIELQNTDVLRHEFAIDNSDIAASALPGFSQKLDFVITKPGTFVFACNLTEEGDHRAAGMEGTIIVEPAP